MQYEDLIRSHCSIYSQEDSKIVARMTTGLGGKRSRIGLPHGFSGGSGLLDALIGALVTTA